jgi:NAD(P)-dependent dehydrogenase (short-subunit alcohol dehydrogenase family)
MQDAYSLKNRRALVVGADSGIGLASARAIAGAGANLVMAGLDPDQGARNAVEIAERAGVEVAFLPVDVRQEDQVAAMVDEAARRLGGLDIAMNNAGIPGVSGAVQDIAAADFDNLFAINVRGAWLCMKYEIPHLLRAGKGAIVNLASTAALKGLPFAGPYAATKHAVAGLTKSAALELAPHNIRVNAIAPGPVNTGLLATMRVGRSEAGGKATQPPMGRISEPEEMTGAVVWLASDASSFVTGALISIDGGVMA